MTTYRFKIGFVKTIYSGEKWQQVCKVVVLAKCYLCVNTEFIKSYTFYFLLVVSVQVCQLEGNNTITNDNVGLPM